MQKSFFLPQNDKYIKLLETETVVTLNPLLKFLTCLIVFRRAESLFAGFHKIVTCINLFCT